MNNVRPALRLLLLFLFLPLYAAVAYFVWLLTDTRPPLRILDSSAPVVVKRGEVMDFFWHVEKFRECDGEFTRYLVDTERRVTFLDLPNSPWLPPGTHKFTLRVAIPSTIVPGRYRYVTTVVWQCSPLRSIPQVFASPIFEVTP